MRQLPFSMRIISAEAEAASSMNELLVGSGNINPQIGERDGPVPGAGADVQAGSSLEQTGTRRQRHRHRLARTQSDGGVVPISVLGFDDGLDAKRRARHRRPRLRREGQGTGGCRVNLGGRSGGGLE